MLEKTAREETRSDSLDILRSKIALVLMNALREEYDGVTFMSDGLDATLMQKLNELIYEEPIGVLSFLEEKSANGKHTYMTRLIRDLLGKCDDKFMKALATYEKTEIAEDEHAKYIHAIKVFCYRWPEQLMDAIVDEFRLDMARYFLTKYIVGRHDSLKLPYLKHLSAAIRSNSMELFEYLKSVHCDKHGALDSSDLPLQTAHYSAATRNDVKTMEYITEVFGHPPTRLLIQVLEAVGNSRNRYLPEDEQPTCFDAIHYILKFATAPEIQYAFPIAAKAKHECIFDLVLSKSLDCKHSVALSEAIAHGYFGRVRKIATSFYAHLTPEQTTILMHKCKTPDDLSMLKYAHDHMYLTRNLTREHLNYVAEHAHISIYYYISGIITPDRSTLECAVKSSEDTALDIVLDLLDNYSHTLSVDRELIILAIRGRNIKVINRLFMIYKGNPTVSMFDAAIHTLDNDVVHAVMIRCDFVPTLGAITALFGYTQTVDNKSTLSGRKYDPIMIKYTNENSPWHMPSIKIRDVLSILYNNCHKEMSGMTNSILCAALSARATECVEYLLDKLDYVTDPVIPTHVFNRFIASGYFVNRAEDWMYLLNRLSKFVTPNESTVFQCVHSGHSRFPMYLYALYWNTDTPLKFTEQNHKDVITAWGEYELARFIQSVLKDDNEYNTRESIDNMVEQLRKDEKQLKSLSIGVSIPMMSKPLNKLVENENTDTMTNEANYDTTGDATKDATSDAKTESTPNMCVMT